MKFYETVFIVRPDATPASVEALTQDYIKVIRDYGGEVTKTEFIGLRTLAYPIKKHKKGYYVLMNLNASSDAINEMDRLMRLKEDVMRHLTVSVESLDPNPSALMQNKGFDYDRPRSFAHSSQDHTPDSMEA